MKKPIILLLILLNSIALFAQKTPKVPTLTYSENYANESLRGKTLTIKGKLVAKDDEGKLLFFLEKQKDKFILTRVYNTGGLFDKDAPKYVKDVMFYHLSPTLLKKLTFKPVENQKGYYQINSEFNNIPYEQHDENKIKTLRWGFGETDENGYDLAGTSTIQIGIFLSSKDFEKFKKELLGKGTK